MHTYTRWPASDLLDIFTNNTVQLISSILLLKANQVSLLQTSLVGGILSNILVLCGGVTNHEQRFNRVGEQGSSSLLSIAATCLLIPTAVKQLKQATPENLILQSRGVAVVLLFVYLTYNFCEMVTHRKDYEDSGKPGQHAIDRLKRGNPSPYGRLRNNAGIIERLVIQTSGQTALPAVEPVMRKSGLRLPLFLDSHKIPVPVLPDQAAAEEENREIRGPHLCFSMAISILAVDHRAALILHQRDGGQHLGTDGEDVDVADTLGASTTADPEPRLCAHFDGCRRLPRADDEVYGGSKYPGGVAGRAAGGVASVVDAC